MWHKREELPPKEGLYVVAKFEGDKMVDWSTNYAYLKERGGWISYSGDPTNYVYKWTHWMTYSEYRKLVESAPRED